MYIGDIHDGSGLQRVARTVIEHSLDRHVARHVRRLRVDVDGPWLIVEDDGPGVRRADIEGLLSGHVGHAHGLFAVAPVCDRLEIESRFEGRVWRVAYERGRTVEPFGCVGASDRCGFRFRMRADGDIFPSPTFEPAEIATLLDDAALLNPLLELRFQGAVLDNREGASGYVARAAPHDCASAYATEDGVLVDVAIGFAQEGEADLRFIVNRERVWRGQHVRGFWEGIGDAAGVRGSIARELLERRLVAVLGVTMEWPVFDSWLPHKQLVSPEVRLVVRRVVGKMLKRRFDAEPLSALREPSRVRRPAR